MSQNHLILSKLKSMKNATDVLMFAIRDYFFSLYKHCINSGIDWYWPVNGYLIRSFCCCVLGCQAFEQE